MEKIESRYPDTYMNNARWKKFDKTRNELIIKLTKDQIAYHENRIQHLGVENAQDSVSMLAKYKNELAKREKRNGNLL